MQNNEHPKGHTTDELARVWQRGEDQTDWARGDALANEELEASIDQTEEGEIDWRIVQVGIPGLKQQLTVRFDANVIAWFKVAARRAG